MSLNISYKISAIDDFSRPMQNFSRQMSEMSNAIDASVGKISDETIAMAREMQSAYKQAKRDMQVFKTEQMAVDYQFFKLSQSSEQYAGKTGELMDEVNRLGKAHKTISDNMLKNNSIMKGEFYQTVGQIMNMSTQAEKISANYDRMGNPLLKVNQAGLKVAHTMNKIANNGRASVLALQMLGPTANMKELYEMQQMINRGVMRFQMVALAAAVTSAVMYSSLHKAAMDTVAGYEEAFNRMKSSVRQALQPMVDVFGMVMIKVYNFIDAIAQMVIAFNNAHPTLAKVLQGIVMLVPALTLLLSPLAIGIGLLAGFKAAFAAVWTMIAPLVTGLAAMSATVWIVAAAIVGLTAGLTYLWQTNEGFRNSVITAWDAIKAKAIEVFQGLLTLISPALEAVKAFVLAKLAELTAFWTEHGAQITQAVTNAMTMITTVIQTAMAVLGPIIQVAWMIIVQIIKSAWIAIQNVINGALAVIQGIIKVFTGLFTGDISLMWEGIKQIFMGALQFLWGLVNLYFIGKLLAPLRAFGSLAKSLMTSVWAGIKAIFNAAVNFVKNIVTNGFNAMRSVVTSIMNAIRTAITTAWNVIKSTVTGALNAIKSIVTSVWNGIKSTITSVMNAIKSAITTAWNAIKSAITTALNAIKTAVTTAFNALKTTVTTAMTNVVNAIKTGWNNAVSFLKGIDLTSIGKNIIQGLINGIGSMAGAAVDKVRGIANDIKGAIQNALDIHSPSRWMRDMIGKNMLIGFQVGLDKERRSTLSKVAEMTNWMKPAAPTIPQTDTSAPYAATRAPQQQQVIYLTVSNNFDGDDVWNAVESRNAAAYIMNNALRGK